MKLPFHNVQVCGDVVFAARGGNIHSFKLTDGSHISHWKYPVEKKDTKSGVQKPEEEAAAPAPSKEEEQGPPAKRVRLDDGKEAKVGNGDAAHDAETEKSAGDKPAGEDGKDQKKGKKAGPRAGGLSQPSERPMVIILTATSDGRHIVAVTQCKSIWVFEHDGHGQLKQLSRRTMPKRPCSLVLTPDNQTILSADKFGDVYSLPLIPSANPPPTTKASSPATPATPAPETPNATTDADANKPSRKPEASELTVHTKRNRRALLHQQLTLQNPNRRGGTQKLEPPAFEHTLLLGHVSLLTAVALARDAQGRPYVVTADRDEHIRVSRGAGGQAHVVESYCLGHDGFVNRLCIPGGEAQAGFGGLLVSGGGDEDLFAWRWREGQLLGRTPLLKVVREEVAPEASKVAVSGLWYWSGRPVEGEEEGVTVLVVVERVPAIFIFTLKANGSLDFSRTIRLPGNPLEVDVVDGETLLVAAEPNARDAGEYDTKKSILKVEHVNGEFQVSDGVINDIPDLGDNETDLTEEEMQALLYSAENLRKMEFDEPGADAE
ncbi:hypothetical protein VPNG_01944 [Cytospora leucostoma]|uniref:Uncharacterized protein n=1 Tax=Cytospora leucostoma TaxID=1230097 RepID=A0A423XIQ7_9PEZI|nr:hypothetical protein VPNG_01944 [Cytospora leucostoma]